MAKQTSASKRYWAGLWNAQFIFSNAFVPLIVLSVYLILFAYFLPDGVNKVFAHKSWKYTILLAGVAGMVSLVLFRSSKRRRPVIKKQVEKITPSDLILLLLPLMPVVQYIIPNREILSLAQIAYVLGIFLAFSLLFVVLIPKLLGGAASTQTLMLLGVAFSFTILNMASLSNQFSWFEKGSLRFQWPFLSGIFIASWFLYDLNYKSLLHLLIVVLFVSNSAVQIFTPHEDTDISLTQYPDNLLAQNPGIDNKLVELVGERTPSSTPNIYLLIYDGYAHNETMLSYGIDNRAQEEYLTNAGFILYPHTYSVAAYSIETMSRVLNASTDYYGVSRRAVSGDGVVQNLLKSFGYRTYGIFQFGWFSRGIEPSYDYSLPEKRGAVAWLVSEAILTGEFRFDQDLDDIPREEYLAAKREVFSVSSNSPIFLYTHSSYPGHSQISGKCLPNETELFEQNLQRANIEMQQDVDLIIDNDPEAIIIIAGDHGPYLTKNCYATSEGGYDLSEITRQDIQDRFGAFLAIRWPSEVFEAFDDITVLQDVFPSVFAFLFQDAGILDARIEPETLQPGKVSGASVKNGIIYGGVDDGEPLFLSGQ